MNQWRKNIVLFLTSQTISLFGSSLVQYAIMWHVTLRTQSGLMMAISIICGFLPTLFLSPFAGVWADRYHRKNLIMISDSVIAMSTLLLAILFFMGFDSLWLLFVVSAVRALGAAVQTPAVSAFIPQLVPADRLVRVNAVNGTIQSVVMLLSPMLSGALLTVSTIESIFFIDVVTAAAAVAVLLLFLHVPIHAKAARSSGAGYFADLREGFAYIDSHDFIKRFFIFGAVFFFLVTPAAFLTPLQVVRSFGGDVWRLTAIEITFSVGMAVGGVVMSIWGGFKNKIHTMALSTLLIGAFTLSLGVIPVFRLYLVFMAFIGLAIPVFNTPSTVLLQQKVEGNFLGRVFGVLTMISSAVMPLGMLVFGPLADVVRIEWQLAATGVLMLAAGLFLLGDKVLLEAGKPLSSPRQNP